MPVYKDSRKKSDPWIADFRYQKRRHWKSFKTQKAAKAWEKAKRAELKRDPLTASAGQPTDITYSALCEWAVDEWQRLDHDAEWIRTKKYILGGPFGCWENTPFECLDRETIETRLTEIKAEVSAEAANRYLRILRAMFNVCVKDGKIGHNPTAGIDEFPRLDKPKGEFIPSQADINKVLLKAKPMDRAYMEIMYNSLARPFEIQRLRWSDVDFAREQLTLWTRKRDKSRSWTPRHIPMNKGLKDALLKVKNEGKKSEEHDFVFWHKRTGKPYRRRPKTLKSLCAAAKVQRFQWRGLRKSGATRMLDAGVPLPTISELLGHTSVETSMRYLGIDKPRLQKAVEVLTT